MLHLGWGIPQYQYKLGDKQIKNSPAEKGLGVLVVEWLDTTQQHALAALKATCPGLYQKQCWQQREGADSPPPLWRDPTCSAAYTYGVPTTGSKTSRGHQVCKDGWFSLSPVRKG